MEHGIEFDSGQSFPPFGFLSVRVVIQAGARPSRYFSSYQNVDNEQTSDKFGWNMVMD